MNRNLFSRSLAVVTSVLPILPLIAGGIFVFYELPGLAVMPNGSDLFLHLHRAFEFLKDGPNALFFDNWSTADAGGKVLVYPPLFQVFLALLWAVFGLANASLIVSILQIFALFLAVWLFAKRFDGSVAAIFSVLLAIVGIPFFKGYFTPMPFTFASILALILAYFVLEKKQAGAFFVALALPYLHGVGLFVVLAAIAFCLGKKRYVPMLKPLVLGILFFIPFLAVFAFNLPKITLMPMLRVIPFNNSMVILFALVALVAIWLNRNEDKVQILFLMLLGMGIFAVSIAQPSRLWEFGYPLLVCLIVSLFSSKRHREAIFSRLIIVIGLVVVALFVLIIVKFNIFFKIHQHSVVQAPIVKSGHFSAYEDSAEVLAGLSNLREPFYGNKQALIVSILAERPTTFSTFMEWTPKNYRAGYRRFNFFENEAGVPRNMRLLYRGASGAIAFAGNESAFKGDKLDFFNALVLLDGKYCSEIEAESLKRLCFRSVAVSSGNESKCLPEYKEDLNWCQLQARMVLPRNSLNVS